MKRINKRLKRLEMMSPDPGAANSATNDSLALRAQQWEFERWQQRRVAQNLRADRECYDAENSANEAARDAAWERHKASLSADELAKIPTHPMAEGALRWHCWRTRRFRPRHY